MRRSCLREVRAKQGLLGVKRNFALGWLGIAGAPTGGAVNIDGADAVGEDLAFAVATWTLSLVGINDTSGTTAVRIEE